MSLPAVSTLYTYLFVILLYPGWRFNLSLTIDLLSLRACLPQAGAARQSSYHNSDALIVEIAAVVPPSQR